MENILLGVLGSWCLFYCGLHVLMFHQAYGWDLHEWRLGVVGLWFCKKGSSMQFVLRLWVLLMVVHLVALIAIIVALFGALT